MARVTTFKFTNVTVSSTKSLTLYDLGYPQNYAQVSDTGAEYLISNGTVDSVPASERIKYFASTPKKKRETLSGLTIERPEVFGVTVEAVGESEVIDENCCADATMRKVPAGCTISFYGPHDDDISGSHYLILLCRAVSALLTTAGQNLLSKLRMGLTHVSDTI